jgi:hypothetical protein
MIEQRCDTILPYPPGNYHVEINTMPVSVRSLDLNFGEIKELGIDVPERYGLQIPIVSEKQAYTILWATAMYSFGK